MLTFKQFLTEEKVVSTQHGQKIKRSELGVGKVENGNTYIHVKYESLIPDQVRLAHCKELLKRTFGNFDYNIIKFSKSGKITFFKCTEFDKKDEPIAGKFVSIDEDDNVKEGSSRHIWHHKWLMVKDDYSGFNVDKSFGRSSEWLKIPNINFGEIADKKKWEEVYVPQIGKHN